MHNYLRRSLFIICILGICILDVYGQTRPAERYEEEEIQLQNLYIEANQKKLLSKFDEAAELLNKILEKDPLNSSVYHDLARVHLALKDYTEAIKAGKKAVQYEPTNIWYLLTLSEIYSANEDPSNQAATLQKVVKLQADEDLYGRLAQSWIKANQPQKALEVYQEVFEQYGLTEYWVDEAITTYLNINDPKSAEKLINNYIKIDPDNADRTLKLGEFYMFTKRPDKAKKEFEKVLELDRNNEGAAFNLAMMDSQKSTSQSPAGIAQLINDSRLDVDFKIKKLIPIIDKYAQGERLDESISVQLESLSNSLVDQYPDEAKVYALSGDLYFISNKWESAIQSYLIALEKEKGIYNIWDQVMQCYVYTQDFEALEDLSMDAIDYYPNQSGPYYFQAIAQFELGDMSESKEYIDEAKFISTEQDPKIEMITMLSTRLDYQSGDIESAIIGLKEYVDSFDASHQSIELLGDLMKEKGDKTNADKYWKLAIEKGGEKQRITQKIQAI